MCHSAAATAKRTSALRHLLPAETRCALVTGRIGIDSRQLRTVGPAEMPGARALFRSGHSRDANLAIRSSSATEPRAFHPSDP